MRREGGRGGGWREGRGNEEGEGVGGGREVRREGGEEDGGRGGGMRRERELVGAGR